MRLRVSTKLIRCFLKEKLDMAFKKVYKAPIRTYFDSSKLQRQYAAASYIRLLRDHKRIINIDESVINSTDRRTQGWCKRSQKVFTVDIDRVPSLNIIAAVSN